MKNVTVVLVLALLVTYAKTQWLWIKATAVTVKQGISMIILPKIVNVTQEPIKIPAVYARLVVINVLNAKILLIIVQSAVMETEIFQQIVNVNQDISILKINNLVDNANPHAKTAPVQVPLVPPVFQEKEETPQHANVPPDSSHHQTAAIVIIIKRY